MLRFLQQKQKIRSILLVIGLILLVFPHFPIGIFPNKVSALSLTYPKLHFYITLDENETEQTFSDQNFYFDLTNNENESYDIVASAEVLGLEDWQEYFSFSFQENELFVEPNQTVRFYPSVTVKTNLSFDYLLHFIFVAEVEGQGNTIVYSAGATAIFSVNAPIPATRLEIFLLDQGTRSRNSYLEIFYSADKPEGYSPFRTFANIRYFNDIVPQGFYYIEAKDLETNITETRHIELRNKTTLEIRFEIIAFLPYQIVAPRLNKDPLIVNYTVVNRYKILDAVTIRVQVKQGNRTVPNGESHEFLEKFFTETFHRQLNISGVVWVTDDYSIQGLIYVYNSLYMNYTKILSLDMPFWQVLFESNFLEQLVPFIPAGILLVVLIYTRYNYKRKQKTEVIAMTDSINEKEFKERYNSTSTSNSKKSQEIDNILLDQKKESKEEIEKILQED
jgi:hypothetical protein